jgi:membrane-associated phospholipid phosphatase
VIKQLTHRQRPSEGDNPNPRLWYGPYALTRSNTSFISGHTSTAFSVATVIAGSYPDEWWIGSGCYLFASLAGWSRLNDNEHWASDVAAGALLGYWVGRSVLKLHPNFNWSAAVSSDKASVYLVWRF